MREINPFGPKISKSNFLPYRRKYWHKTFLGKKQRHIYWLYAIIDEILNENPRIKGIIEIGTWKGTLSMFLGLECYERKFKPLLTFDIKKHELPRLFGLLKIDFVLQDCFAEGSIKKIKQYLDIPVFFFCDGGNKVREFKQFAPLLPKNSVIAVHDWPHEAYYACIKNTVKKLRLIPLKAETWCIPPYYIFTSFWKRC